MIHVHLNVNFIGNYMKWKWCKPTEHWLENCLNWVCVCGHDVSFHVGGFIECVGYPSTGCSCQKFKFGSNDNCTMECVFQRKIFEIENNA